MAAKLIEVLDPTAVTGTVELELAPRVDDLNGKVLCLMGNVKPNFDIFLARMEELLRQKFKLAEVMHAPKGSGGPSAGMPCPPELMEKVVAKSDVVINGMCD